MGVKGPGASSASQELRPQPQSTQNAETPTVKTTPNVVSGGGRWLLWEGR